MRLALGRNSLLAAILLIVVLAAALVVSCPDGIHLPVSGSADTACAVMTHSSVLATVADANRGLPLLPLMLAIGVALIAASGTTRLELAVSRADVSSWRPVDPLNGRLRI